MLFTHSPRTPTLRHCDACDSSEANASTRDDAEIDSSRQGRRSVRKISNIMEEHTIIMMSLSLRVQMHVTETTTTVTTTSRQ